MKKMTRIFGALLLVSAALILTSCKDDEPGIPESVVSWTLTLPETASDGTVSDVTSLFTNINTSTTYKGAVTSATKATVLTVSATVPEGLYKISVEGTLTYTADDGSKVTSGFRALRESVAIAGESATVPETQTEFYTPSEGFVISEIFFTGTFTDVAGDWYNDDHYIKIRNNSDQILYADSLAIMTSQFLATTKYDYTPDIMKDFFSVSWVFMIPGTGKDVPVQPGEELVIAMMGIDHREYNSRSFDLSKADFEFFDDDAAGTVYPDTDGPTVPNLEKWYSESLTVSDFHNRGNMTVAIARMQGTKEDFLLNNKYTATYTFTFGDFSREMTTETYKVPNAWIVDAVGCSPRDEFQWLVIDPSLDAGWTWCAENNSDKTRFDKAVVRKTGIDGKLLDTNSSTNDFTACAKPSLMQ